MNYLIFMWDWKAFKLIKIASRYKAHNCCYDHPYYRTPKKRITRQLTLYIDH